MHSNADLTRIVLYDITMVNGAQHAELCTAGHVWWSAMRTVTGWPDGPAMAVYLNQLSPINYCQGHSRR